MEEGVGIDDGAVRRTWPDHAGFEDGGRRPGAKGFRQSLEAGKGQETNSP